MTPFAEWEADRFPTVQATADAIGVGRQHIYRLRSGEVAVTPQLRLLMIAIDLLLARGEEWPPEQVREAR